MVDYFVGKQSRETERLTLRIAELEDKLEKLTKKLKANKEQDKAVEKRLAALEKLHTPAPTTRPHTYVTPITTPAPQYTSTTTTKQLDPETVDTLVEVTLSEENIRNLTAALLVKIDSAKGVELPNNTYFKDTYLEDLSARLYKTMEEVIEVIHPETEQTTES